MILKHFLKPKWRHSNPMVRLQAIESLGSADQDIFFEISRNDADPAVRRSACKRLERLAALATLAEEDSDAGVRELAAARFRTLLSGQAPGHPPMEERKQLLLQTQDPRVLQHVALHGQERELRFSAIERITEPELLAECAIKDPASGNRLLAVQKLSSRHFLEQVSREIKGRDKNAYRLARAKLKEIAEREAAPVRIRAQYIELCERAERLGQFKNWLQDRAVLDYLDQQWATAEGEADGELQERYRQARSRFLADYEAYRQENQALVEAAEERQRTLQARTEVIKDLTALLGCNDEAKLRESLSRLSAQWSQIAAASQADDALKKEYQDIAGRLRERLKDLSDQRHRDERLSLINEQLDTFASQGKPLDQKGVGQLLQEADALLQHSPQQGLAEHVATRRARVQARLQKQVDTAKLKLTQLPERLDELQQHLEAGELRKTEPLSQSIQADLDLVNASGISRKRLRDAEQRLHRLLAQMRELKQWRKWGTDEHRKELCTQVEGLIEADIGLEELAALLHQHQMEWKQLDQNHYPTNQVLWDRFHAACEKVYERCRPYLDELATQRERNRRHREEICSELEEFLDKVDWDRIDWKKAMHAERETRQAWAAAGPVENKYRKALTKRFRAAMDQLDQRLEQERSRNLAFRKDLIARIEALKEHPDLDFAIEQTKQLQRQWHTTVAGRQKQENSIWRQFRGACDQVFERRRELQHAQDQALQENLRARQRVCEGLQALSQENLDPHTLEQRFHELHTQWRETADLELPKPAYGKLKQAWQEAEQSYRQRLQQLRLQQQRAQLSLLREKAELCRQLELSILQPGAEMPDPSGLAARWEQLPAQEDQQLQEAIAWRHRKAQRAAERPGEPRDELISELEDNRRRREEICLHMEILAGLDSPPELAEQRLAFQVSRLAERVDGEGDPLEAAPQLERDWYVCGPAPQADMASLDTRFERALHALQEQDQAL